MTRHAHFVRLEEARHYDVLGVAVHFDAESAFISEGIVAALPELDLPANLTRSWCSAQGLRDEVGSSITERSLRGPSVVLVAAGATLNDLESYRRAGAALVSAAGERDAAFFLATDGVEHADDVAQALVEGALLASYRYREGAESRFGVVAVGSPLPSVDAHTLVGEGVSRGATVAESVNWAKQLINTPANVMTPRELTRAIVEHLEHEHVSTRVWDEGDLARERCGALLGVARGSSEPPRLVSATYDPEPGAAMAHVALVGKGVTFDSGGLSLKPADAMTLMKTDMTGAAVVMACVGVVARLGLRVRVSAIAPMAENVVGESAMKPGDVLVARNGLSIEVLNTDAEGRLLLADALSLAVEGEPDAIIDIATLTGAQRVALGNGVGAMFATTDELARYLTEASERSGEALWRMPLVGAYRAQLDSDVADLANIGRAGQAGAIVAALFLERFSAGVPWAHLDVVGPARAESASGYVTKGATAFGARTLIEFLVAVSKGHVI
jgi:leucyl aminopeptidase